MQFGYTPQQLGGGQVYYAPLAPAFDPTQLLQTLLPLIVMIMVMVMMFRMIGKIIPGAE